MSYSPLRMHHDRALTTLQESVDELRRRSPTLPDRWSGEIMVGGIMLPGFIESGLAQLIGPRAPDGSRWSIGMPSSADFTARRATCRHRDVYPIERLHRATVDEEANVTLADDEETRIFDVRLDPSPLHAELTAREQLGLRMVLACIGMEMCPIRYDLLPGLPIPPLKQIIGYIDDQRAADPGIPEMSLEVLRSALAKAWWRRPRYRRGGRR